MDGLNAGPMTKREEIAVSSLEEYPVVLLCDGLRGRPSQVLSMGNGTWRVDWTEGLVSLYRGDPRGHLKLGYEPGHLRWWPSPREGDQKRASLRIAGLGR